MSVEPVPTSDRTERADARHPRIVVLSDPGAGEAGALEWAAADLATQPDHRMVVGHPSGDRVDALVRSLRPQDTIVVPAPPFAPARRTAMVAAHGPGVVVAVRPSSPPPGVTAGLFAGRVLIGVDDGATDAAPIEYGFDYADRHDLPVVVIHAHQPSGSGVWADTDATPQPLGHRFGFDLLDAAVADARERHQDVDVRRVLLRERAASALVGASRGAILLVVGDRGRGAIARGVLGSVSRDAVRHAHCSVAVVHHAEAGSR